MPGKMALVDYNRCHPDECENGVCVAALACRRRLLQQEAPRGAPMTNPAACAGCADCVRACPLKAIQIMRM